jgi:hypothetical protein
VGHDALDGWFMDRAATSGPWDTNGRLASESTWLSLFEFTHNSPRGESMRVHLAQKLTGCRQLESRLSVLKSQTGRPRHSARTPARRPVTPCDRRYPTAWLHRFSHIQQSVRGYSTYLVLRVSILLSLVPTFIPD